MRQALLTKYDPKPGISVDTLAWEYAPGFQVPEHAHGSDQLIYAIRGVMEVSAGQSLWLIPPQSAIWIPARTQHRIRMPGAVSMRTLYLRCGLAPRLPQECIVLHVTPLLRELTVEAVRIGQLRSRNRLHRALRDLLLFHLQASPAMPAFLTMPRDPRAVAVAQALISNPANGSPLAALSAAAGVSVRTVERIFLGETGTSLEVFRRQVRLMKAIELLSAGRSVKESAFLVGYRQPAAFVKMFRRAMGNTPLVWARNRIPHGTW